MRGESLEALRERPFRLLWLASLTSAVGDGMTPIALTFAVLDVTDSARALGLVFAAFTLSHSVFILAGGVWSDRLERRVVMLSCDLVRCGALLVLAVLVISEHVVLWQFVVLSAVVGAAESFFAPASTGLVPQTVSPARLQNANALLALNRSASWIAGPALSGVIVAAVGAGWVFAIDAATFAGSAAFLSVLRVGTALVAERRSFLSELAEGWHAVRARRWLWASLVSFGIGNMAWGAQGVLGPLVAEEELGGAAAWGAILTAGGIGGAVGGVVALRWRPSRPLVASHLVVLGMAGYLLLFALSLPTVALVLGAFAAFVSIVVANTLWETVLQSEVPHEVLSRVSSYDWAISLVFMPIGFALWGPISGLVGVETAFVIAALVSAAAKLGPVLVPDVRNLRRADAVPRASQAAT
ncbi:MFS transporter [Gaiella sp.]|uniref:MFS transporter n=1 Tax=Gaiella sp. TaxID=2663207 RepID=UPI002E33A96A|nr:MFS transporter [Gaiella sp.]HEX5583576.1 MFS transporter [Gaiella sp.]